MGVHITRLIFVLTTLCLVASASARRAGGHVVAFSLTPAASTERATIRNRAVVGRYTDNHVSSFSSSRLPSSSSSSALSAVLSGKEPEALSYSETRRTFYRDFYTHESWLKHRRKDRYIGTITKIFQSGVVRQLADEVMLIGFVAAFVVLYNAMFVTGWEDFALNHHEPLVDMTLPLFWLPLEGFTICSSALSLLLVFRTNVSYQRWDEARKAWGIIVNNSRTVIRETGAWILKAEDISAEEKQRLTRRVADAVWLFPRSMRRHLLQAAEDAEPYVVDVRAKLPPKLAEEMIQARHKPVRALFEMSCAVNEIPLDTIQRSTIDQAVSQLCDASGGCERIFSSPVPLTYTRHTARFIELWLFFLPLALYKVFGGDVWNHWAMIPVSMLIAFFFLGIEELSIQLEEPFSLLPLDKIAAGIGLSAEEHVIWMEEKLGVRQPTAAAPPAPASLPSSTSSSSSTKPKNHAPWSKGSAHKPLPPTGVDSPYLSSLGK